MSEKRRLPLAVRVRIASLASDVWGLKERLKDRERRIRTARRELANVRWRRTEARLAVERALDLRRKRKGR